MNDEQIAHDLAVAKLYGSDLQTKELLEQYRKYYIEILDCLKSEPKIKPKTSNIMQSPI